jgi:hypothetical protein
LRWQRARESPEPVITKLVDHSAHGLHCRAILTSSARMAFRTSSALALLALFGAVLFLQVALADEARNGDVITASSDADIDFYSTTPSGIDQDSEDEVEDVDEGQLFDMADRGSEDTADEDTADEDGKELGEIQPYVYFPEADEVEVDDQEQEEASAEARPLARILHERSSKKCWSKKKCQKFYKSPGCCNRRCVNLSNDNRHCGACWKHCGWGRKCCGGKCVSILSDGYNCGRCGHKCAKHVKCRYGICGYGH